MDVPWCRSGRTGCVSSTVGGWSVVQLQTTDVSAAYLLPERQCRSAACHEYSTDEIVTVP